MKTLYLLFSHRLTAEQERDARASLGVVSFVPLPPELQQLWSNLPPELEDIRPLLEPVKQWLTANARPGDMALVTGDFGATWDLVNFCHSTGITPLYSTSRRVVVEERDTGGSVVKKSLFAHVRFRQYIP